jgi:iron complex transport system substrate-binding protein
MSYPQRIVCLAAEAPEIIDRLGCFDHIVGVSGFARRPATVRRLPKVGGFSDPDIEKILGLLPDLVITTSDIQADAAAQLIRHGIPVLALNPHRLAHIWTNILLVGGTLGRQQEAMALVAQLQRELDGLRAEMGSADQLPRVYFEEWPDPMISGIGWVSDLIGWLGGVDIFAEVAAQRLARDRIVTADAVLARQPEVIIASWCGKRADLKSICARAGWEQLPAVQRGAVYEIASDLILQTGPGLLEGARQLAILLHARPLEKIER